MITLDRIGSTPWGTLGTLTIPGQEPFATLEPQWRNNAPGVSCIPAGRYPLILRSSPLIQRITDGAYQRAWGIENVPNRSLIILHPGNFEKDTKGCPLIGAAHEMIGKTPGISGSLQSWQMLMKMLATRATWEILILWTNPEAGTDQEQVLQEEKPAPSVGRYKAW